MAVRFPMSGEIAPLQRLPEGIRAELLIIFENRCLARYRAARKDDAAIIGAGGPGEPDQRVLAGAAWPDHQNQPAGPERARRMIRYGRHLSHATRCPSRQTLPTTGISWATWTRIRSPRFPTAISPRSARPPASAGVLVTVRTADARSMAGTCRGNCSAAINRLEGM